MVRFFRLSTLLISCSFILSMPLLAQQDRPVPASPDTNIRTAAQTEGAPIQKEKKEAPEKSLSPEKSEIDYGKLLAESQRNLDRSLSTLSTVGTLMGVLVALVTLIIAIGAGAGFFQWKNLRSYVQKIREDSRIIEEVRKKHESEFVAIQTTFERLPRGHDYILNKDETEKLEIQTRRIEVLDALGFPLKAETYHLWGAHLFLQGKYYASVDILNRGLAKKADQGAFQFKFLALRELERYQDALEAATKAVELFPESSRAWYDKACAHSLLKEKEKALDSLSKAISIGPGHKREAQHDKDFSFIQEDKRFIEITKE